MQANLLPFTPPTPRHHTRVIVWQGKRYQRRRMWRTVRRIAYRAAFVMALGYLATCAFMLWHVAHMAAAALQ